MPLRNLTIIALAAIVSLACYRVAPRNHYASVLAHTMRIIDQEYVDEVKLQQLFEGAMQGMVVGLDQYSGYINPEQYARLQKELNQQFDGIGILVELDPESKRLRVKFPLPNTPAHRGGVKAGDIILEINGQSTENLSLIDALKMMKGKKGTPVQLLVQHLNEQKPVLIELLREEIPIESVLGDTRKKDSSWNFYLQEHPRIGYIRLKGFGEKTADELRDALNFDDHSIDVLILDLRDNPGGILQAAVDICDMFIDRGRIVSTRGRGAVNKSTYDAHRNLTIVDRGMPVAILTNQFSASASEIVAACLQDHQRAVIIGQRTWGKGSVQNIIRLERGRSGALRLTTASYWRPSGKNIHRKKDATDSEDWGVRPDENMEVNITDEQMNRIRILRDQRDTVNAIGPGAEESSGEETEETSAPLREDPQLDKAIEYLQRQLKAANSKPRKA